MTPIIVCGAMGKMGSRILELASQNSHFKINGALEHSGHSSIGKKILDGKVLVESELEKLKAAESTLIDFTNPAATLEHLKAVQNWKRTALVIGTTGLSTEGVKLIQETSKKFPIVFSPNMSVGVNLMFDLAREVAQKLTGYDIEIVETHHNQKKDAPSGTALGLAKEIADALERDPEKDFIYGRQGEVGQRTKKEIGIHSVRAGDVVGDHTVIFANSGERLEITHRASSRDAFASGALRAALWVYTQKAGLYSMKDVLAG